MVVWSFALVAAVLTAALVLAAGAAGAPVVLALAPVVIVAVGVATSGWERRLRAWRSWPGHRGDLIVADFAADPPGRGAGGRLMDGLVQAADAAQRTLLLRVDSDNAAALHVYTARGFTPLDSLPARSVRMSRRPGTP